MRVVRLFVVVGLTVSVAYIGFSVKESVESLLVEVRGIRAACYSARKAPSDPDVLKELPEASSWYSQHCKD